MSDKTGYRYSRFTVHKEIFLVNMIDIIFEILKTRQVCISVVPVVIGQISDQCCDLVRFWIQPEFSTILS